MKRILSLFVFLAFAAAMSAQELQDFTFNITFITPSIARVRWTVDPNASSNNTGVCVYAEPSVKWEKKITDDGIEVSTDELTVTYYPTSFAVSFYDKDENLMLTQRNDLKAETVVQERIIYDEKSAHMEETANGKVTVKDIIRRDTIGTSTRYQVSFYSNGEKALYGLGAHMEDYMNLQGKTLYLTQHNLKATVPMLCSTNGYGLLFDAGCAMKYTSTDINDQGCGHENGYSYTMQLEAAKCLDYYFIKGEKMDDVIAGYRYLTGNVSLMPRYVFGYTQSKERYVSSDDLINTLREYRRRHVPIDMIVQDWNYWPQGWGYMKMNPKYYPDPKALANSIHAMNAKLMVSIWPNPQWCPEAEDFKQKGMMLEHDVYDVFNPEARKHYWKYANDEFFSRGFDAWWCDSSEPLDGDWNQLPPPVNGKKYAWDDHERRWHLNKDVLSDALGAERSSLYSLYHSMGIYENQRLTTSDKRVVNLTRSTYAGQQRYGTIVWNGDTHASWESFRQQIPAGLNYMATGNPYWTVDVGSFFTRNSGRQWFYTGEFPKGVNDEAYRDYYVRMFQWGTFLPMLRSHGSDTPREIWRFGEPGTKYYDEILKMINLRYTLIPYIYSMAAKQTFDNYTMARLLAFDFPEDDNVLDIKDEYMFGDFLVCPVTSPNATSRKVYLPKGTRWHNYFTSEVFDGGQWIDAPCALESTNNKPSTDNKDTTYKVKHTTNSLPLFVREGAIIPTTEVAEYSDAQKNLPVTINIFRSKDKTYNIQDKTYNLYEDEGDNYDFEQGAYSLIPLSWNEKKATLTIGTRSGSFPGMQTERTFIVSSSDGKLKTVKYKGKKLTVKL